MVKLTLFVKTNCTYCGRVKDLIVALTKSICSELGYSTSSVCPVQLIDISERPEMAALCIRLSGKLTVPQAFFNDKYLGDASKFNCCLKNYEASRVCVRDRCPEMFHVLLQLMKQGLMENPKPGFDFPPPLTARMVKVTNDVAFSACPSIAQLKNLSKFGFKSVVNILTPHALAFDKRTQQVLSDTGANFFHLPLFTFSVRTLIDLSNQFEEADIPSPVLIYDDTGRNAGIVALLVAFKSFIAMNSSTPFSTLERMFLDSWMPDMNLKLHDENEQNIVRKVLQNLSLGSFAATKQK